MKNIDNKIFKDNALKRKGEKSIKRNPLALSIREGYFKGRTGLGTELTMEIVPKDKNVFVTREKIQKKNPEKQNIFSFWDEKMKVNFCYYKNTRKFYLFYSGGYHKGMIQVTEKQALLISKILQKIPYIYIYNSTRKRKK